MLSGNADTGKTAWRNYMMKLCYDKGYSVIDYDLARNTLRVLQPHRVALSYSGTAYGAFEYLSQRDVSAADVLYMCDTFTMCEAYPAGLDCATVVISVV